MPKILKATIYLTYRDDYDITEAQTPYQAELNIRGALRSGKRLLYEPSEVEVVDAEYIDD